MTDTAAALTYDAVGGTRDAGRGWSAPAGFAPLERVAGLGYGRERFEFASGEVMSWGIQRRSGFTVTVLEGDPQHLAVGDTAVLAIPVGPFRVNAPARVTYVIDEPRRRGFAYGTLPGHPECGEEAFIVELRDGDSVWITIRAFSRPSSRWWWAVYPALRLAQEFYTHRYLRALAVPIE